MTLRVFSYGGGVQSTAALVLAAQGKIDFKTFLFCNVGDDSENPATITYVRDIAMPYAKAHGIELIELHNTHFGEPTTLYQHLTRPGSKSIGIPVRMAGSGAPGRRSCTADFKINVVDRWLKQNTVRGHIQELKEAVVRRYAFGKLDKETVLRFMVDIDAFFQEHEPAAHVGLGISLDEIERVKPNMDPETVAWKVNAFPLIDEVERPLTRQDCMNVIAGAGLPIPAKSACVFCPFHTLARWQEMRQHEPESFWKAAGLEKFLNERRASLGMDPVWFTRLLKPLDQATHDYGQRGLFESFDGCEEGYCGL